jgi:HEAT repeat protein
MSRTLTHSEHGRRFALTASLTVVLAMSAASGCSRQKADDVPQLVETLKDTDSDARYQAVKTLGNRGAEAREAVPAMIALLKDPHTSVRVVTAYALGKIGPAAASAVPALTAALDDPNKEVRQAAAYSLPALGPDATTAWKALQKTAARDVDPSVRKEAAKSMAKIQTVYRFRQAADARKVGQTAEGRP